MPWSQITSNQADSAAISQPIRNVTACSPVYTRMNESEIMFSRPKCTPMWRGLSTYWRR
ncbi:hypothetical protein D3C87_2015220 [compost metagenome]